MNLVKRALVMSAGAAMAAGLLAGTASAASAFPPPFPPPFTTVTATTTVNTLAGGNGGFWAGVRVTRTATVTGGVPVPAWFCGPGAPACFRYRATLGDHGVFTSFFHALTPNQYRPGRHIRGIVHGRVNGSASFTTFFASTVPSALNVPVSVTGLAGAPGLWPVRFFAPGTRFGGVHMSPWTFTYTALTFCGLQIWTDASWNGGGNLRFDGNITGCF
jgi:hypothetical protein